MVLTLFLFDMLVLAFTAPGAKPKRGAPSSSDALRDYSQPSGPAPIHIVIVRETTGAPIYGRWTVPDGPDTIVVVGYEHQKQEKSWMNGLEDIYGFRD